jgi:hypothetical protein
MKGPGLGRNGSQFRPFYSLRKRFRRGPGAFFSVCSVAGCLSLFALSFRLISNSLSMAFDRSLNLVNSPRRRCFRALRTSRRVMTSPASLTDCRHRNRSLNTRTSATLQGKTGDPLRLKGYWSAIESREGDIWKDRMQIWNVAPASVPPA